MRCLTDSIFTRALIVGFALLSFALQPARASDFEIAAQQGYVIMVMSADGSSQTPVYSTPWGVPDAPSWSPDGKSLAFKHREGIYRIDGVDQGQLTEWPSGTLLVPGDGYCRDANGGQHAFVWMGDPSWSPAGHEIVFEAAGGLCVASSSTPSSSESPPEFLIEGNFDKPTWNSVGSRIATVEFYPNDPQLPSRVTIIDRATGTRVKSFAVLIDGQPDDSWSWLDWARNGDPRVAFSTSGFKNQWIYTLDTSQTDYENPEIKSWLAGLDPSWSPDNSQLVYVNPKGHGKLSRYTFSTGQVEDLAVGWFPDWRPPPLACSENADCNDGNPCTDDVCDGLCSYVPNFDPCDDGNECTSDDGCDGNGLCLGVEADDGESCSGGYCCSGQCVVPECKVNVDCDDGDDCTIGICDYPGPCAASCQYEPSSDPACQCLPKGESCATNDECCSGQCHPVKSTCK